MPSPVAILAAALVKNASVKSAADSPLTPRLGDKEATRWFQTRNAQMDDPQGLNAAANWAKAPSDAVLPGEVQEFIKRKYGPKDNGLWSQYKDEVSDMASATGRGISTAAEAVGGAMVDSARAVGGGIADTAQAGADAAHGLFDKSKKGPATTDEIAAATPKRTGMVDKYVKNLKSGDPTTLVGTGAVAVLAGLLTHNLLKKRNKR